MVPGLPGTGAPFPCAYAHAHTHFDAHFPQRPRGWENSSSKFVHAHSVILEAEIVDFWLETVGGRILGFPRSKKSKNVSMHVSVHMSIRIQVQPLNGRRVPMNSVKTKSRLKKSMLEQASWGYMSVHMSIRMPTCMSIHMSISIHLCTRAHPCICAYLEYHAYTHV